MPMPRSATVTLTCAPDLSAAIAIDPPAAPYLIALSIRF